MSSTISYDFSVRMYRDIFDQYVVDMFEISGLSIKEIPFIFDSGATYTQLNKDLAEERGWKIFATGLELGGYLTDAPPTVYDLRTIPKLAFGNKQIYELVVATPTDGNIKVSNLLGRSFIDNFAHGVEPDIGRIFFRQRNIKIDPLKSFGRIAHSLQA